MDFSESLLWPQAAILWKRNSVLVRGDLLDVVEVALRSYSAAVL